MGTEEWSDFLGPTDMRGGSANFYVISTLLNTAFQARGKAGDVAFLDRGIVGYSGVAAMMVGDTGGSLTRVILWLTQDWQRQGSLGWSHCSLQEDYETDYSTV